MLRFLRETHEACNVAAQTLVPAEGSPKALLVMAPSAGGKTTAAWHEERDQDLLKAENHARRAETYHED